MKRRLKPPRRLLLNNCSAVYHVMSRMVRRQFWLGDPEKEMFVRMLKKQAQFAGVEVLTFCVLDNHFHLLVRVPECPVRETGQHRISDEELMVRYRALYSGEHLPDSAYSPDELEAFMADGEEEAVEAVRVRILERMGNLPVFVKELKQRFSIWFNHQHRNDGTIWSARFKSLLVEDCPEVLAKVAAYIDLNPVRAEMVADPAMYRWCGLAEAQAGGRFARQGLGALFGVRDEKRYGEVMRWYRLIIYGKGGASKTGAVHRGSDLGRIDKAVVRRVLEAGGELPLNEALRCRIRYFRDGCALGGKDFIAQFLTENEDLPKGRSRRRGLPVKGAVWDGLCSLRNLKKAVFE